MKGKITAWCFPCKHAVTIDKNIKIIKKLLPNDRVVTIATGHCTGPLCSSRVSAIIANEATTPAKRKSMKAASMKAATSSKKATSSKRATTSKKKATSSKK